MLLALPALLIVLLYLMKMIPEEFFGVGSFYEDFEQVSDEEVIFYLYKLKGLRKTG